jgi:hypothetical protein
MRPRDTWLVELVGSSEAKNNVPGLVRFFVRFFCRVLNSP